MRVAHRRESANVAGLSQIDPDGYPTLPGKEYLILPLKVGRSGRPGQSFQGYFLTAVRVCRPSPLRTFCPAWKTQERMEREAVNLADFLENRFAGCAGFVVNPEQLAH